MKTSAVKCQRISSHIDDSQYGICDTSCSKADALLSLSDHAHESNSLSYAVNGWTFRMHVLRTYLAAWLDTADACPPEFTWQHSFGLSLVTDL